MRSSSYAGLAAFLLLSLAWLGCETEPSTSLTPEARNAFEVLPSGARFVGMVDFQRIQRNDALSPFGQGAYSLRNLPGGAGDQLRDFAEATGIDLEQDLKKAYVASDGGNENVSLVLFARYDQARLQSFLEDLLDDEAEVDEYRGVRIFRNRRGERGAFALPGNEILLASPREHNVEAMIDRYLDGERSLKDDDALLALIEKTRNGAGWVVMKGLDFEDSPGPGAERLMREAAQIGRAVQDVTFSFDVLPEGLEGHAVLIPKSGVSADDLAALMKGIVAAVKLQPNLGDHLLRTLDDLHIRSRGDEVDVGFSVDNATLAYR